MRFKNNMPLTHKTQDFYSNLAEMHSLAEITSDQKYQDVPDDWTIVLTDVKGSTKAIEMGKYKEVNTVAASSIAALLNVCGDINIPFVFGGDGTTAIVPNSLFKEVEQAMSATQKLSKNKFDLDIRVALIPIKELKEKGFELKISKLKISDLYSQAIYKGDGFDQAEIILKDINQTQYDLKASLEPMANFSGLTCRWQDIPGRRGQILSLIVKTTTNDKNQEKNIYNQIIAKINQIFGDYKEYQPVVASSLNLSLDLERLSQESRVVTGISSKLKTWNHLLQIYFINLFGRFQELFGTKMAGYNFKTMKEAMVNTDYKKFDGALKMIISSTKQQSLELREYLEKLHQQKQLVYGIHTTNRALITCLVSPMAHQEVHFVDGADGGYALAAKEMKTQIKSR
jgi:hypothetical protein